MNKVKKATKHKAPKGPFECTLDCNLEDAVKCMETMAELLSVLGDIFATTAEEYVKTVQRPGNSKPAKAAKPHGGKSKPGTLSKEEQAKVRQLRKQGCSIKAIGKAIHRGEKTVADFVRKVDAEKK